MRHITKQLLLAAAVLLATATVTSCGEDFQSDIDSLNGRSAAVERRVAALETEMESLNGQLSQLSQLTAAIENNFYITEVGTTAGGYELKLSNGRVVTLDLTPDNWLIPTPALSLTRISGFYYWTLNGLLLTDGDGSPIRTSELTPVVKYDYKTQQWLVSVDGGVTYQSINIYSTMVLNNEVLAQVINAFVREHSDTLIRQETLFQILSTYIQQNYARLFNVSLLSEVVGTYISENYTRLFTYQQLTEIFDRYSAEYMERHINVERLKEVIITFLREHTEIFLSNDVLLEIVNNYINVNSTTIFTDQMLLEVVNNFTDNHSDFINVELLQEVIFDYIDGHQDTLIDVEVIKAVLQRYVQANYVQIFSQDILLQVLNTYVAQNETTIFNETLIREIITNYVENNHTAIITDVQIRELINDYLELNTTTVINRELLAEIITAYFATNYNRFVNKTDIQTIVNNYIEQHSATLIDVDIIRSIVATYVEQYYSQVFNYEMLTQVVSNYFQENQTILRRYFSEHSGVVAAIEAGSEEVALTLNDGQTVSLVVYDAMSRLRDRVQSIVVMPNPDGSVSAPTGSSMQLSCLVTPDAMAQVLLSKFQSHELTMAMKATDDAGNIATLPVQSVTSPVAGMITVEASIASVASIKAVALHVKENAVVGTEYITDFVSVGSDGHSATNLVLSEHALTLNVGETAIVRVLSGSGKYSVSSSALDYATATTEWDMDHNYQLVIIRGIGQGKANITVTDMNTGQTATVNVTVQAATASLNLDPMSLTLTVGETGNVWISGSGYYSVKSSNTAIATVTRSGNMLSINGIHPGTATVTVTDTQTNQSKSVAVTVKAAAASLTLSAYTLTLKVGESKSVTITSGSGSYDINNPDGNIISVSKSGNTLTFTGKKAGNVTVTVQDNQTQQSKTIAITVTSSSVGYKTCPDNHHPHMIDLGLPSGTLWACCNVGASAPEQSGGCYAWGETSTKDVYTWGTYKFCNASGNKLIKYCTNSSSGMVDNKRTLEAADDAATATWGASWCMPTESQFVELYEKCEKKYSLESITFVGINGGILNMPIAGRIYSDQIKTVGAKLGAYWSSSLNISDDRTSKAVSMSIPNSPVLPGVELQGEIGISNESRYGGLCIRPVYK